MKEGRRQVDDMLAVVQCALRLKLKLPRLIIFSSRTVTKTCAKAVRILVVRCEGYGLCGELLYSPLLF
jgi:hypothetical protein